MEVDGIVTRVMDEAVYTEAEKDGHPEKRRISNQLIKSRKSAGNLRKFVLKKRSKKYRNYPKDVDSGQDIPDEERYVLNAPTKISVDEDNNPPKETQTLKLSSGACTVQKKNGKNYRTFDCYLTTEDGNEAVRFFDRCRHLAIPRIHAYNFHPIEFGRSKKYREMTITGSLEKFLAFKATEKADARDGFIALSEFVIKMLDTNKLRPISSPKGKTFCNANYEVYEEPDDEDTLTEISSSPERDVASSFSQGTDSDGSEVTDTTHLPVDRSASTTHSIELPLLDPAITPPPAKKPKEDKRLGCRSDGAVLLTQNGKEVPIVWFEAKSANLEFHKNDHEEIENTPANSTLFQRTFVQACKSFMPTLIKEEEGIKRFIFFFAFKNRFVLLTFRKIRDEVDHFFETYDYPQLNEAFKAVDINKCLVNQYYLLLKEVIENV